MDKKKEYLSLLSKNYDDALDFLIEKYGPAKDDYFSKKSYKRFLNGEIENITKGNYSRTSEGLYCHHIDEINHENLSNEKYIKDYKYPFDLHKKDRLVYCDLFEHAILHALISKETSFQFGIGGYNYIEAIIKDWYIDENYPGLKWMQNCYDKAYMNYKDSYKLLSKVNDLLTKEKIKLEQEQNRKIMKIIKENDIRELDSNSTRSEIINGMYILKENGASGYNNIFKDSVYSEEFGVTMNEPVMLEVFKDRMESYDLDGVLENIELFIAYKEDRLSSHEYLEKSYACAITKKEAEAKRKADIERKKLEKIKEKEDQEKKEKFYNKYPAFKESGVKYNLTRQEVNVLLFKYYDEFSCFIKFQGAVKELDRDQLLDKLYVFKKEKQES